MDKIKYELIEFEGMWFWQRISDGKLVKRLHELEWFLNGRF